MSVTIEISCDPNSSSSTLSISTSSSSYSSGMLFIVVPKKIDFHLFLIYTWNNSEQQFEIIQKMKAEGV